MPISSNSIFSLPVGRHPDGDGLYLNVGTGGRRSWQLRIRVNGKSTMIGIGTLPPMGLAAARQTARRMLGEAASGRHPKPKAEAPVTPSTISGPTVAQVWKVYADTEVDLKEWTPDHRRRTDLQMNRHLGSTPIWHQPAAALTRLTIIATCEGIRSREIRQRVFRWWRAAHENALNIGMVENSVFPLTMPKTIIRPAGDVGTLAGDISDIEVLRKLLRDSWFSDAALSIRAVHRVVALTGHRVGAVLQSGVDAYDAGADSFTVPRSAMKIKDNKRGDVVITPLSPQLREALKQAQDRAVAIRSDWLFPNLSGAEPVLNESVIKHINRLRPAGTKFTPHSWRSVIMSWALDAGHSREAAQVVLDHARGTDADRHYDRSQMRQQVAALLADWAKYICKSS